MGLVLTNYPLNLTINLLIETVAFTTVTVTQHSYLCIICLESFAFIIRVDLFIINQFDLDISISLLDNGNFVYRNVANKLITNST